MNLSTMNLSLRTCKLNKDNLLIDKALVEDATKNAKNISCVWIDVKEAIDSVAHNWLVTVLKDHGVNERLVCFIEKIT